MQQKKMAFYELHEGKLALEMQRAFENVTRSANESGSKTKVSLEIEIEPAKDGKYGAVSFRIKEKHPSKESIKRTTLIDASGVIVSDGTSITDILQEELEFKKETKIHKIGGSNEQ